MELSAAFDGIHLRQVDAALPESTDLELVTGIAGGDRHALVTLFRRRRLEIYRFALHMTGIDATAEDVTQEVFITVMRDASRYDATRGTVISWLLGIARNLVRRRLERDRFLEPLDLSEQTEPANDTANPLHELSRAERVALIRRAVMSLPSRYREVVLLCDLQELSYADTAAALHCAVGTVRSRLHRARALLAEKLQHVNETGDLEVRKRRCFA